MHIFNESFNLNQSGAYVAHIGLGCPIYHSLATVPQHYTPTVYIDPKVQPPFPKQAMTKHPKSHKTRQTDIIAGS